MKKLCVTKDNRYLMTDDGQPFFYLADTAWELFHRLTEEQADFYFSIRAVQGFNVIQASLLAEFSGLSVSNPYGRLPLKMTNGVYNPCEPDTDGPHSYWNSVDEMLRCAENYGLYMALLPTWGDKFNKLWGEGPEIFTADNAYAYGKWLGSRYCERTNIIWMLGGDRPLTTDNHRKIIESMANGLRDGDGGTHLITFHPSGAQSSADYLAGRDYIDFHTVQSSHSIETYLSYKMVRNTFYKDKKPFMDSEPRYDGHPACFDASVGYYWNADDVRQNTYWNLMEGVCGNTYGNHAVWPFRKLEEKSDYFPYAWEEVLHTDGAEQAVYAKKLRLSRPYFEFRPDMSLADDTDAQNGYQMSHIASGRGDNYAFIYTPLGMPIHVHLGMFKGKYARASWFDPRTGHEQPFAVVGLGDALFVPPSSGKGCDWILIIDVCK